MDTQFTITALDDKGDVKFSETTRESWSISELQNYFDACKIELYTGGINHLVISRATIKP